MGSGKSPSSISYIAKLCYISLETPTKLLFYIVQHKICRMKEQAIGSSKITKEKSP